MQTGIGAMKGKSLVLEERITRMATFGVGGQGRPLGGRTSNLRSQGWLMEPDPGWCAQKPQGRKARTATEGPGRRPEGQGGAGKVAIQDHQSLLQQEVIKGLRKESHVICFFKNNSGSFVENELKACGSTGERSWQ